MNTFIRNKFSRDIIFKDITNFDTKDLYSICDVNKFPTF